MNGITVWSYLAKYKYNDTTMFASKSLTMPEKINLGIVGKPGQRLQLFSEFKILQDDRSDCLAGFRARF